MNYRQILLTLFVAVLTDWVAAQGLNELDSIRRMQDVVVTGSRNAMDIRQMSQTVTVIDREKLTENFRESVLPTLMEQVPGLMVTSRGMMGYGVSTGAAGGMMLRGIGSGEGRMMVLIDGHPQYNGIYSHSIADSYQTMTAEKVEVLRGPASMLYGSNAMGGVINIVTRGAKGSQRLNSSIGLNGSRWCRSEINLGAGSWGTVQAEASNVSRIGRFSSTFAMQYGRSDNHRPDMGFQQYGGFLKLGYDISEHWNVFADADITHFNSSYPGKVSKPKYENDQSVSRYAVNLVFEDNYTSLKTKSGIPLSLSGAVGFYDNFGRHTINDGYVVGVESPKSDLFQSKDAVAGANVYQSLVIGWRNQTIITVGVDYQHIYGRAWYTDRKTGAVVTTKKRLMQSCNANEDEIAGYFQVRQQITGFVTLDAGLRIDHHTVAGTELVPQFGVAIRPINSGEIKLSVSKGFRNPSTKEMYLYGSANSDSLRAERMWNYEVSWHQHLMNDRLTYGVNVFYINADNIIQAVNNRNINTGRLKNCGVELEAEWRVDDHWSVNTNHSYLYMYNPVVSAPTYKGFIGGSFHSKHWMAVVGLMQICGLYTGIGADEKIENVTLLNATLSYQPVKFMRLWVKGDNLLAQHYETIVDMPMPRATFMAGVQFRF